MDDAESVEFDEEGVDVGDPCTISVNISYRSGVQEVLSFQAPLWTPIYAEPITGENIYAIVSSAYSFGESPFFAIPTGTGSYKFLDLNSTNFIEVAVNYD